VGELAQQRVTYSHPFAMLLNVKALLLLNLLAG
jgi:hypothetical protein